MVKGAGTLYVLDALSVYSRREAVVKENPQGEFSSCVGDENKLAEA
jgi:hypothetical protein